MRHLNIKLAAILGVGLLTLSLVVHFVHGFQVQRNAGALMGMAGEAKDGGNYKEAVNLYNRYIQIRPDDSEAYKKRAEALVAAAKLPTASSADRRRAFDALFAAVGHNEDDLELRRTYVEYCLKAHSWTAAIQELAFLMSHDKDNPQYDYQLAECYTAVGKYEEAAALCEKLIGYDSKATPAAFDVAKARDPHKIEAYVLLADLRYGKDKELAEKILDQAVAANEKSVDAYLQRVNFHRSHGLGAKVNEEIVAVAALAPDDANVIVLEGGAAFADKKYEEAKAQYEKGAKLYPTDERMYGGLRDVAAAQNNEAEVKAVLERGLKELPSSQPLLNQKADSQLREHDFDRARKTRQKLAESGADDVSLALLDARIDMIDEQWLSASRILELRVRPRLAQNAQMAQRRTQIDLLLGMCYSKLQQTDRQMEIYREILIEDTGSMQAHIGLARALLATGKTEDALAQYDIIERGLSQADLERMPDVMLTILALREAREATKPKGEQNWEPLEAMLDHIKSLKLLNEAQQAVSMSELLNYQGKFEEARALLTKALQKQPKDLALWTALKTVALRENEGSRENDGTKEALAVLDRAQKELGDIVPLRIMRADLMTRQPADKAKSELQALSQGAEKFSVADQSRLWENLGFDFNRVGDRAAAVEMWERVAKLKPDDLGVRLRLFEMARAVGDEEPLKKAQAEIARVSGKDSAEWKYTEAARLLGEVNRSRHTSGTAAPDPNAEAETKRNLAEAQRLLTDARAARRDWPQLMQLQAEVESLEGKNDLAVADFERMLEVGTASPEQVKHLAQLYSATGQYQKALNAIRKLSKNRPPELARIEAELLEHTGQLDAAIALAEKLIPKDSKNANDLTWYGQLLDRADRSQDAETRFKQAVELAPDRAEIWLAYLAHLIGAKRRAEAEQLLAEAATKLPADRAPMFLAQGNELLGNLAEAERNYHDAQQAQPNDAGRQSALALFYLRQKRTQDAKPWLQKILDSGNSEYMPWARRNMATILSTPTGDYQDHLAALKLIDQNAGPQGGSREDRLLKADLLSARDDATSRHEAIKLLEQLQHENPNQPLPFPEQLALARLYERTGNWSQAHDMMQALVGQDKNNPALLATYVGMLLNHQELAEAETWANRLVDAQPNVPGVILLQAQVLAEQGKSKEAFDRLNALIHRPIKKEDFGNLLTVAGLLEQMDLLDDAEKLYREYADNDPAAIEVKENEQSQSGVKANTALAGFKARHRPVEECLTMCEGLLKKGTNLEYIQVALQSLREHQKTITPAQIAKVESWILKARKANPDSKVLTYQLADLRDLQGQDAEVESLYREMLKREDLSRQEKAMIWNNLAFILAVQDKNTSEALKWVQQSIAILGPRPDMLDTRGMVMLASDEPKRAITDFNEAITDDLKNGQRYFHLALAQQAAGDDDAAKKSMARAKELKFEAANVSRLERPKYDRLISKLELATN